jgi:signal transduction histidine kinase
MKRAFNKGRRHIRYGRSNPQIWRSLERFHTMGLRLAGFMHQFKTPLHVIQSQAELLLDDPQLPVSLRHSLEIIQQNTARLSTQTQTMMEAARGKSDPLEIIPVERLVEDICHAVETDCRKRNISIQKDILATQPIRMEPVALEGALHNLVNNAIEAMPSGGVLKIKTFEAPDLKHIGLEIQDSGPGMSTEELIRIRKPFQTTKAKGTGLGVYITRHILKRHHASVRWQSKLGEGTKVTMIFPVGKAA